MGDKIKYILINTRCVKKELTFNNKKYKVYVIKDTDARATPHGIIVSQSFFENTNEEQAAILYHEEYHMKLSTSLKRVFNLITSLSFRKVKWKEEYAADEYAACKTGKAAVKSYLTKSKSHYDSGKVAYNSKTHPPIEKRIKQIDKLV
jgi:Zn-dependent protease with chaperone function